MKIDFIHNNKIAQRYSDCGLVSVNSDRSRVNNKVAHYRE